MSTPQGARLIHEEAALLDEAVRRFHGDTLLWVGCHEGISLTVRGCMIRNRLFASQLAGPCPEELSTLRCTLDALPLPNNSLDAMVMHHTLEVSADARSGLREAARVLVPGGRLVICAFNPLSLYGVRRAYAGLVPDTFSGLRLLTTYRLLDWLALLGFERHASVQFLSYNLPLSGSRRDTPGSRHEPAKGRTARLLRRLQLPFGGVHIISVVKQAAALTPVGRVERVKASGLLPAAYPKSAVNRVAPVLKFSDWKDLERGG